MTIANITSQFDTTLGYIIPENQGTWADLSGDTWANWTLWLNSPAEPMVHHLPPIDLGSNVYFNLTSTASVVGNLTYNIHTSQTGDFAGEETTTTIFSGNVGETQGNLDAFYGRYVLLQANVTNTGALPSIQAMSYTAQTNPFTIRLNDLDITTLAASGNAYVVPLGRTVGAVTNMQTTAHYNGNVLITNTVSKNRVAPTVSMHYLSEGTGGVTSYYVETDYVDTDYFETTSIGGTSSVMANATVGVFDAVVTCLPQQGRLDNNLVIL